MPLKLDVMLSGSVVDAAERAQALERAGVDGVFSFENAHDLFFPLVAAAPVCSLDLLTNVAIAFPRSPLHLAHAAYDLQLLSRGRFRLGLGSQVRAHIEKRYGARWDRPVAQMREWVLATKAILDSWQDGTRLDFRGDYTSHTLMTPAFNPGPNPYGLPKVLVGALGPKMNQMAAEVADGNLVMPFNSDRHMRERTMPAIEAGLAAAGRSRAEIAVTAEVIVAVGRTDEELTAARAARGVLGFYGSTPSYRQVLEVEGWGHLQPELNARSKRGDWAGMTELIDDEMLGTLGVFGTPDQVAAEIVRRFGHCDRVCAYFPGYPVGDDLLADLARALRAASGPAVEAGVTPAGTAAGTAAS
ncbi:TIGR03617 family F420-dependent LLM class oxidoreductase [Frankia sp. AgB1.9]|uniref:TIGR03617 family F420-dependent LLM class oxidoreductase n=1 Tax=unclassified Frankia TaxID=2632575 RepID=UPI001933927E|nr:MULTISPECIES: TIGR03617 family F420-dependent LLM class oxidoreductase [unclassified Frankia]MBL7489379.1 TIGR03617 family F420-dependent LLM class oxidoreductase [Frankia sp. AgW1.1]MBL7548684.1 TIGR03617 family F420-dependent LLM class oxidoreductase [Frankia sp. AgB1.9]MBL7619282.1 TIGR03617 family F420-dependent LLM class oxidoreductase [Frankia sp. AgB1.8]